jgi:hypothetical protein
MPTDHEPPSTARASSGPAGPLASAGASPGPLQPAGLIAFLQRTQLSCTQGYDVVSIVAADRVNELFGQEYVTRAAAGEAFAPVSGRVAIGGNQYATFSGLVLGQPLISFSPGAQPQEANLRVEFLSGTVTTEQVENEITTVLSAQHVTPGSGFALTGVVPLVDVQGKADPNTHEVRLDITNASDFAAHMNIPGAGARTALGQFFLSLMQQDAGSWAYVLGSLNYSAGPSTKLVPTSFEIATQVDSADPADTGRVLLFITTAYGTAPAGRPGAMQLPNMVPAGSTTTLIVANRVLLGNMVRDVLKASLAPLGGTISVTSANPAIPGSLYAVTVEGSSANLGRVSYGPTISGGYYLTYSSGTPDPGNSIDVLPSDVVVPLSGLAVAAGGAGLNTTAQLRWNQPWAVKQVLIKNPPASPPAGAGTIPMTVSLSGQQTATIDADGTVSFGHPPPVTISFQEDTNFWDELWKGTDAGTVVARTIQTNFQGQLQQILSLQLPAVRTFAVNNLLFPSDHNIKFSSAYVPGDLVTFGDLATSAIIMAPLYATLAPGQTYRFSASAPGGSAVHWTLGIDGAGSITADGTYQAPDVIPSTTHDVVTAWTTVGGQRQTASAVVTLVPAGLSISPDYAVIAPGGAPQQFVATAAGEAAGIHWSLVGQDVPGTLVDGLYTPPAQLKDMQAVTVRATRASDGLTADALLILTPFSPQGVQVNPPVLASPLAAGKSQQFTATGAGSAPATATWSVLPAIGAISNGLYTAPANVTAPTTVAVVATVYPNYVFGLATLQIAPNPPPPARISPP